jgi:hypothetical protein
MSWDKLIVKLIYWGLPVVTLYHQVCENSFLNVAASDAEGLEKVGNTVLAPVQFLLGGKVAVQRDGKYRLEQRFNYNEGLILKSVGAVVSFPLVLPLGSLVKGASYISDGTRRRHEKITKALYSSEIHSHLKAYRALGLAVDESKERLETPLHKRRPGEELSLKLEKELLKNIVHLLKIHRIPFWVDCGTCLGAYRYGGVIPWDGDIDLAVLAPDFDNVMRVLSKGLDSQKYHVQDWSSRCRPKTYIRVYIRENRNYIDFYHFGIDPTTQTLASILSYENSAFMIESWKIREKRFTIPSAYETIFPLKKADFDGIEVYVPNQTKKYLQERYGENIGPVKIYNEATGEYEKDLSHPYWQLPYVYQ